jgi:hypothetical protein
LELLYLLPYNIYKRNNMKRIKILSIILLGGMLTVATSCKKYLDVNTNPNSPTDVTPDLILPAALAQTAANNVTFNSYGAWAGGYQANAGGYGGFGSVLTYNYATSDNNGLWSSSFNNLNDYQTIINKSDAKGVYKNYNAIAKIMKAYNYIRLIDVYNDVPYTDALKGLDLLNPKYDKAEDVYRGLFRELNEAIASLALPNDPNSTIRTNTSPNSSRIDIITSGESDAAPWETSAGFPSSKWTAFANTLKLKMLVRARAVPTFAATLAEEKAKLQSATFVTYDVKAQPGYTGQGGKQNPSWDAYAYNATGGNSQLTTIPTWYAIGFYDGHKLTDDVRGVGHKDPLVTYKSYTVANQLGITDAFVPSASTTGGQWYTGTATGTSGDALGVLKGPSMAQPLLLASESYFLQSEANLFGILPGGTSATTTAFNNGIKASIRYLYTTQAEGLSSVYEGDPDFEEYLDENPTSPLVHFELALTDAQKLEAIITQKWISENYIHSNEGWSDYRRTGYPRVVPGGDKYQTFASVQSSSTRVDKLPVRVLYPASEYALNSANVPQGINAFTSRVFYDLD